MEMKQYTVNNIGLAEIAEFLRENHRRGKTISESDEALRAWVKDAEFQLGEGNPASVEIKSWETVNGRTQEFTVSDRGLDIEIIHIEE